MNRIIIFVILLLITSLLGYFFKNDENEHIQEDFSNIENRTLHNNPITIYDEFYTSLYDELFLNKIKNEFEIYNTELYTINEPKYKNKFLKEDIRFLDLGCGNGKHLDIILRKKYRADAIDISEPMLKRAKILINKNKYASDVKLVQGDFMKDTSIFTNSKYTHIICMFYTVYYIKDTKVLFTNIYNSLKDGGYMIVHLVNKKLFDPVLEKASKLIPLFNPQRHSNSRITKTKLKFNKFDYVADWDIRENDMNVVFRENFIFKDKNRQLLVNEHIFYMRNIPYYKNMAKSLGFELVKIVDLLPTNHDNSYIYIFRKM
jgi:SAM-dependent methyltransferase